MRNICRIAASVLVISTRSSAFVPQSSKKSNVLSLGPATTTGTASTGCVPRPSELFLSDRALGVPVEETISATKETSQAPAPTGTTLPLQGAVGEADAEYRRGLLTIGFSK